LGVGQLDANRFSALWLNSRPARGYIQLVLSAAEDSSYREIADLLGFSPDATRKHIYRSKQQVRAVCGALDGE
jgi:DNA-directed RNA polymerase specialized sigma24 family protein